MNKKILLFLFLQLFFVEYAFAVHMKITLQNNTYDIRSSCITPEEPSYNSADYSCPRKYVIELKSKYNVFENYHWATRAVTIKTSLHNIRPETHAANKSVLNIYLDESELKKLLETDEAKIEFELSLFSEDLLRKELNNYNRRTGSYNYSFDILEPSITIDLKNISRQNLVSECSQEGIQCKEKLESLNSPMKRLKRFFN